MITKTIATLEYSADWQISLANAIRDPAQLLEKLRLPVELLPAARAAAQHFSLRVPLPYLSRIEAGNPQDPLLRQVLPLGAELNETGQTDPVGDAMAMLSPGLLQKYNGRALLIATGACAIHCRYCFRRHFPYAEANPVASHWPQTMQILMRNTDINEIILSGGDPLSLSDQRLSRLVGALDRLAHLQTLRIHTRLPVVLPERITAHLCRLLEQTRMKTIMVLHINHPREIDDAVALAVQQLRHTNTILLNQAVLLRTVNDDADTLETLSRRLFDIGVLPYYLHQLDPVRGAMHFRVDESRGQALMQMLRARLPGYLVPRYVQEIPESVSKIPL